MNELHFDSENQTNQNLFLQRMNAARRFPTNTCPASRVSAMIAEAMITGQPYPLMEEEPIHCGEMIAATVAALWELRSDYAQLDYDKPHGHQTA